MLSGSQSMSSELELLSLHFKKDAAFSTFGTTEPIGRQRSELKST